MAKVLRGMLRVVGWMLVLIVLAVAVVALLRARALGDDGRAALALMGAPPAPLQGRDGFAALMLSGHDVPPERLDAVLADDIAAFSAWHAEVEAKQPFWSYDEVESFGMVEAYSPLSGIVHAERPALPSLDDMCGLGAPDCLEMVRNREAAIAELLHEHRDRLASVEQALAADHLVNRYPPTISTPLPPYGGLRLPLTAAALDAVQGRAPQAYERTCGLLASARRMDRQGRNLVEKLIGQSLAEGAAWLLLDLRRDFPVASLPAVCEVARAPVDTGEAMVCEAMRGEFRMQRALGAQLDAQLVGWNPKSLLTRRLLFDAELQASWSAREFAPYCADATRDLADAGLPPPTPAPAVGFDRADCYAAYISCVLAQIAGPGFHDYAHRSLDHAAKLRLLLAAQAAADGTASATDAAAAASVAGYPVDFDPVTQVATITLRQPRDGDASFRVDFGGLVPGSRLTSLEGLARL